MKSVRSLAIDALGTIGLEPKIRALHARLSGLGIRHGKASDGLPMPPPHLIFLIGGQHDPDDFIRSGQVIFQTLTQELAACGLSLSQFETALDFGCGVGRVLRHMVKVNGPSFHGTDYNPKLIKWAAANLPAQFSNNKLEPPLLYPSGQFDFIFSRSVFTHLPEQTGLNWIAELRRVLRPGGVLMFTTHGDNPHYRKTFSEAEARIFDQGRFVIRNEATPGANRCAAFHPADYVKSSMLSGFELLRHRTGDVDQDVWTVRKL